MSNAKINDLRAITVDESVPAAERSAAAEHYVTALVDAVEMPADDDPEVTELRRPWPRDTELARSIADSFSDATSGRSVNGWSVRDATVEVLRLQRFHVVLAVALDESAHGLERLAACQSILDDFTPAHNAYRANHYTAKRLLDELTVEGSLRYLRLSPRHS